MNDTALKTSLQTGNSDLASAEMESTKSFDLSLKSENEQSCNGSRTMAPVGPESVTVAVQDEC